MNKWYYYSLFWLPVLYPLYDTLSELIRWAGYENNFGIGIVVVIPVVLFIALLYATWAFILVQYKKKKIGLFFLISGVLQIVKGVENNTDFVKEGCRVLARKSILLLMYQGLLFLALSFLFLYFLIGNMVLFYQQQPHFGWMAIEALAIVVAYLHLNFLAVVGYEKPEEISWKRHFGILLTIGLVVPVTVFGFIMSFLYFYGLSTLSAF